MVILLATAITSFVISFLTVPVIIKYSFKKNLVDIPGRRKIHKKVTPSMGGIAIFIGFFISSLIWIEILDWKEIKFILFSLFVIFFIGVRDDLVPLRAIIKLLGQIMAACLIVFLLDLRLHSMYGLLGIGDLHPVISTLLTILTIIIITNSFNLIDGLDGLAGTIATIALIAFGTWFYLVEDHIYAVLAFSMVGGIFAFLIFNWDPSEVFMGDTGALVIGMMLSMLTIHFIETNYSLPNAHEYKFNATVGTAVCFIIIPLVDTLRIIILRVSKKKSPFSPDKSHIHHALLRLGMGHEKTTIILGAIHIICIALAVIFRNRTEGFILPGIVIFALLLSVLLDRLILNRLKGKEIELD